MISIVNIIGGLGNQMFQYAFAMHLSHRFPRHKVYIDSRDLQHYDRHNGYELSRLFRLHITEPPHWLTHPGRWLTKRLTYRHTEGQDYIYSPWRPTTYKPLCYHYGYWQNEAYFLPIAHQLREVFTFDLEKCSAKTKEIKKMIATTDFPVSIHIRRGDYITDANANIVHGNICTLEYYQQAIEEMKKQAGDRISFFVFSDDIPWVKNHSSLPNAVYVDHNKGVDSWQDMFLMSRCKHHIIANSSFSWWGAWLNEHNDKIVIAPSKFLNTTSVADIIPSSWIKIAIPEKN